MASTLWAQSQANRSFVFALCAVYVREQGPDEDSPGALKACVDAPQALVRARTPREAMVAGLEDEKVREALGIERWTAGRRLLVLRVQVTPQAQERAQELVDRGGWNPIPKRYVEGYEGAQLEWGLCYR